MGQKMVYKVTEYSKKKSEISNDDANNIKWAVKAGNGNTKELADRGEKITLDIDVAWEGKDISVMAYIGNTEKASQKTNVLQDTFKGTLIRGVIGEDEAFARQEIRYEAVNSNKDGEAGKVNDSSDVKWAIKVDKNGSIDKDMLKDKKGKRVISLEMRKEWAGKEITVMPYLNSPTETVSVKTKVYMSLGSAIKKALNDSNDFSESIYEHSDLFIGKLIDYMESKNLKVNWLQKFSNSSIKLKKSDKGLATTEREIVVININHIFFKKDEIINDRILQAIVLHELRHVWQKGSKEWEEELIKYRRMEDGERKQYSNIFIEVDAFDIQFEFEDKSGTEVDFGTINRIRNYFKKEDRFRSSKKLKAEHLIKRDVYGIGYYYKDENGKITYADREGYYYEYDQN